MKNLFDYATKELSQDAFLRWFLESNINNSGKKLIAEFIGNEDFKSISDIKTWAQSEDIDITVDFKVNGIPHILIIEDKVGTNPHDNQLIKYMNIVDKWNKQRNDDRPSYFIYFKPRVLSNYEREQIEQANQTHGSWSWKTFDIDKIHAFFIQYEKTEDAVLFQYVEHIDKIYKSCHNKKLPSDNNIIEWQAYFDNIIKNNIQLDEYNIYSREYQGRYAMIIVSLKGDKNKNTPYLEIRSRDCLNGKIVGRILTYGKEMDENEKKCFRDIIGKNGRLFVKENYDKQIASTKTNVTYKQEEEFVNAIKQIVEEYIEITIMKY